ncbi:MAG: hypothetical protein M3Q97_04485 [Bacteroidota bacterium]|nr:hypothetical protein [Bacteroidota bacterium]
MDDLATMTDTGTFYRIRGQRQYELSSHLGNVMATVSDRKLQHTSGGDTVDYYDADVKNIFDYYAFGSLMPDRSGVMGCDSVPVADTTYAADFELILVITMLNPGEDIHFTDPVATYPLAAFNPAYVSVQQYIDDILAFNGSFPGYTFTQISPTEVKVVINKAQSGYNCNDLIAFAVGNAFSGTITIDCAPIITYHNEWMCGLVNDSVSTYRYGFNGMERDDEVKGIGNSYDFGARVYDSRLGCFLSVDPLYKIYEEVSPYVFAINNPIKYIDDNGKGPIDTTTWRRRSTVTMITTSYILHLYSQSLRATAYDRALELAADLDEMGSGSPGGRLHDAVTTPETIDEFATGHEFITREGNISTLAGRNKELGGHYTKRDAAQ